MSVRFRLLGVLPLAVYIVHLHYNWSRGGPGHGLWMCHISNVALGLGLLCAYAPLVRVAIIWSIPLTPLWIMDMVRTGEIPAITFFSHLGGLVVGLIGLWHVRAGRRTWLYALVWYLCIQQISRMVTPPELNVNIAHTMYVGWERIFSAYWHYWLFTTVSAAGVLWILGYIFFKVVPPYQVNVFEGEDHGD
jgi:hypothetical protein